MSDKCSSVRGTSILQLCLSREDWGSVVSKKHPRPHPAPIRAGAEDSKGRLMTEHSGAESGGEGDEEEDRQKEGKLQDSKACRCMKEEWGAGTPWKKKKISALRSSYEQRGPKAESGTPSRTSLTCESSMVAELELQEVQFGNGEKHKYFVQSSMPTEGLDRSGCREVLHGAANCFQVCRPISFSLGPRIERPLHSERTNKCCLLHTDYGTCEGENSGQKAHKRCPIEPLCPGRSFTDQLMNWAPARWRRRYAKHESSKLVIDSSEARWVKWVMSVPSCLHRLDFNLICMSQVKELHIRN